MIPRPNDHSRILTQDELRREMRRLLGDAFADEIEHRLALAAVRAAYHEKWFYQMAGGRLN